MAEAAGVIYCIEPLSRDQTSCINTIKDAAEIVRSIDSPAIRTMLDCSSAGLTESEIEEMARLIRRLRRALEAPPDHLIVSADASQIFGFAYFPKGVLNCPSRLTRYSPLKHVLFRKIMRAA